MLKKVWIFFYLLIILESEAALPLRKEERETATDSTDIGKEERWLKVMLIALSKNQSTLAIVHSATNSSFHFM
jgi:hypothetical protein